MPASLIVVAQRIVRLYGLRDLVVHVGSLLKIVHHRSLLITSKFNYGLINLNDSEGGWDGSDEITISVPVGLLLTTMKG
jgi:hypothetical protein